MKGCLQKQSGKTIIYRCFTLEKVKDMDELNELEVIMAVVLKIVIKFGCERYTPEN